MSKLHYNMAVSAEDCIRSLQAGGKVTNPISEDGSLWCNATWDSVLCWPAIPADSSYSLPCPPLKGLDVTKSVTKQCHSSGRWMGRTETDFSNPSGFTNYIDCMLLDIRTVEVASDIARGIRYFELVGLALSLVVLAVTILVLAFSGRFRLFRNQLHLHLMLAILIVIATRLILYIDLLATEMHNEQGSGPWKINSISTTRGVCEAMLLRLEYAKTVAFTWMFIEALYLHDTAFVKEFKEPRRPWIYLFVGWGVPVLNVAIWLATVAETREIEICFGTYYLHFELWILESVKFALALASLLFLLNAMRLILCNGAYTTSQPAILRQLKQVDYMASVIAATVLVLVLIIPHITQQILLPPPKQEGIVSFTVFNYTFAFISAYQGVLISVVCVLVDGGFLTALMTYCRRPRTNTTHQTTTTCPESGSGHMQQPAGHDPLSPLEPQPETEMAECPQKRA